MLLYAGLIVLGKFLLERNRVFPDRVQNAPLAIDPSFFAASEQPIEQRSGNISGGNARS